MKVAVVWSWIDCEWNIDSIYKKEEDAEKRVEELEVTAEERGHDRPYIQTIEVK